MSHVSSYRFSFIFASVVVALLLKFWTQIEPKFVGFCLHCNNRNNGNPFHTGKCGLRQFNNISETATEQTLKTFFGFKILSCNCSICNNHISDCNILLSDPLLFSNYHKAAITKTYCFTKKKMEK